jgi:hypothetical protein
MNRNTPISMVDNYFGLINGLSRENKLALIAKISSSMIEPETKDNPVDRFFGSFISEKSAEEIISEIRESRTFNRKIVSF